ncbi:MAG: trypsin-like peptidase domain-containing protein [Kiritimatiellia bacterium]
MIRYLPLASLYLIFAFPSLAEDMRNDFGTRSTVCAEALDKAIRLSGEKQQAAALQQILRAVKADPKCDLATYWHASILMDMGDFDQGVEIGTRMVEAARVKPEGPLSLVPVSMAIDMGLAYGKLGNLTESSYWLSQAILLDMKDASSSQWKAYRNMSINSYRSGDALSALLQALKAKELAPTRVTDDMLREIAKELRSGQPCINILSFNRMPVPTQHPVRANPAKMTRSAETEARLEQNFKLAAVVSIPGRKLVYLFYKDLLQVDAIETGSGQVTKIQISAPVAAAIGSPDTLFLCSAKAPTLEALSLAGKPVRSYALPGVATSVAVCPLTQQAFLAISDLIHVLDLTTGKIQATDLVGQVVRIDAPRGLVYSTFKPEDRREPNHMFMNGRPVFFSSVGDMFKDQNVIFKGAYKRGGLTAVAAIRTEAASNGYTMDVSRDGQWITVTGGGGYRGPGGLQGYGTGVLFADDMARLEGFYGINAYPQTAVFNPVTDQLALVATEELKVFNLGADKEGFQAAGKFCSVAQWSPDGAWLFVGNSEKGSRVYRNTLTTTDEQTFAVIQRAIQAMDQSAAASNQVATVRPVAPAESRKMPALAQFTPATTLSSAKVKAAAGSKSSTQGGPPFVTDVPLYAKDSALLAKIQNSLSDFKKQEAGLVVYQLKGILKEKPGFPPTTCALGYVQCVNNNAKEGIPLLIESVRTDAGQSTVTSEALYYLGEAYLKEGREAEALDCLSSGLLVDKDHEMTIQLVTPLMKKHGIAYRDGVASAPPDVNTPATTSGVPKLNWPPHWKTEKPLSAEELFEVIAHRTASIKTDSGYGSGVFITDDGYLLTNQHVVKNRSSSVDVTMFAVKNGKVEKAGVSTASIVYVDRENDIALLKVNQPQAGQKGLSISKDAPPTGMKVFAIGSPGMSERVLEQSLTEGIISSNQRMLDGQSWLQHSAAINPGNSGGPLVSQYGEIVGLVTMKANLENVGFAIPAARLRQILNPR